MQWTCSGLAELPAPDTDCNTSTYIACTAYGHVACRAASDNAVCAYVVLTPVQTTQASSVGSLQIGTFHDALYVNNL